MSQIWKGFIKGGIKGVMTKLTLVFIVILVFAAWQALGKRRAKKKTAVQRRLKQDKCRTVDPAESIFVSVASYRDPECPMTVFDCLEKADCPLRIFIGVCQQNYPVDADVLEGYKRLAKKQGSGNYSGQIRVTSMDAGQAQGPMLARSLIEQNLYQQERYYLIIDSHTLFTPGWDTRAIEMLKQCPTLRAVLTMYPDNYDERRGNLAKLKPPSYLRLKKFNEKTGLPEVEGPACTHRPSRPLPSLFWGGCFSFARGEMIKEVPYDPYCPYVFLGEEISMAARLYTHGWDLFTPTDMIVRHMWARRRPTFWEQFGGNSKIHKFRQTLEHQGYRRLRNLFQLQSMQEGDQPLGKYGLGPVRSLEQYQKFCGVNLLLGTATTEAWSGVTVNASEEELYHKLGQNFQR